MGKAGAIKIQGLLNSAQAVQNLHTPLSTARWETERVISVQIEQKNHSRRFLLSTARLFHSDRHVVLPRWATTAVLSNLTDLEMSSLICWKEHYLPSRNPSKTGDEISIFFLLRSWPKAIALSRVWQMTAVERRVGDCYIFYSRGEWLRFAYCMERRPYQYMISLGISWVRSPYVCGRLKLVWCSPTSYVAY